MDKSLAETTFINVVKTCKNFVHKDYKWTYKLNSFVVQLRKAIDEEDEDLIVSLAKEFETIVFVMNYNRHFDKVIS